MFMDFVQCTALEVKTIDGLGTTLDVVLVNGELREGDTIVVCTMDGPVTTQIRALLTPPAMKEMRVKSDYVHHKRIEAAMGIKVGGAAVLPPHCPSPLIPAPWQIAAHGLEKAVAGTSVLVAGHEDEIPELQDEVMAEYDAVMKGFKRDTVGVYVQARRRGRGTLIGG